MIVRAEVVADRDAIRGVHRASFPAGAEARLVDALRAGGRLTVSLVAVDGGRVVGHVAFSPVTVDAFAGGLGLGPVGVLPAYRGRGVGAQLVRGGLGACAGMGGRFVVVLGEPRYYARFGFEPARRWGLRDEYGGGDAFQALELEAGALGGDRGARHGDAGARGDGGRVRARSGGDVDRLVRYAPEFAALPST